MKHAFAKAIVAVWVIIPGLLLLPLAFGLAGFESFGGENAVSATRLVRLAWNSLRVSGGAALLAVCLAVPIALAAVRALPRRQGVVLLAVSCIPIFVPPTVIAVAAIRIFGPAGVLTKLITGGEATFPVTEQLLGPAPQVPGAPIYTLWGGAFAMAWSFYPLAVLALAAALAYGERAAEEAALLETNAPGVLRRVTLPLASGGVAAGAALVFLFAMTDLGVPEALRSIPVLVSEVYVQFSVYFDTRLALASSLLLVALAAAAWAGAAALFKRTALGSGGDHSTGDVELPLPARRQLRPLGAFGWVAGVAPAAVLVASLLLTATVKEGPLALWALVWSTAKEEFFLTLLLGAATGLVAGGVAVVLGSALAGLQKPMLARVLVLAPLIVPAPVFGVPVPYLLRLPPGSLPLGVDDLLAGVADGYGPLVAIWTLRFAPIAALILEQALRAIPREVRELARMEGVGAMRWFAEVALPAVWPSLAAGMVIAFALSLGDVGAAMLLVPPGTTTLGVRLFTLMHWAPEGEVSALSLMLVAPGLAAYVVAVVLLGLGRQRTKVNQER